MLSVLSVVPVVPMLAMSFVFEGPDRIGSALSTAFTADALPSGLGMRLVTALAKGNPATAVTVDRTVPHGRVVVLLTL